MTMWDHVILTIVSVSIPVLIGYALKLFNSYVAVKTHSVKIQHAFQVASDTVQSIVDSMTQTFTSSLNNTTDLNEDAVKQAIAQSTQTAKQLISTDVQSTIQNETGDFESWLTVKVGQIIQSKNTN